MKKPNLYILGAAKSGTTTLYDLLRQHPQIFLTIDKEPMFFSRDDYYERGMSWYLKTFYSRSDDFSIRGEASPHYLYWADKVAPRIYSAYKNTPVKFIIMLRNPIERAYSWYWNMIADGRESLPFIDVIKEECRLEKEGKTLDFYGGYLRGGYYTEQIQAFLKYFNKEQFLFLIQDDLRKNLKGVYQQTCKFLEVSSEVDVNFRTSNTASLPRFEMVNQFIRRSSGFKDFLRPFIPSVLRQKIYIVLLRFNKKTFRYPEMSEEAHDFLLQHYHQEIDSLSDFLGLDLEHWRK